MYWCQRVGFSEKLFWVASVHSVKGAFTRGRARNLAPSKAYCRSQRLDVWPESTPRPGLSFSHRRRKTIDLAGTTQSICHLAKHRSIYRWASINIVPAEVQPGIWVIEWISGRTHVYAALFVEFFKNKVQHCSNMRWWHFKFPKEILLYLYIISARSDSPSQPPTWWRRFCTNITTIRVHFFSGG